MNVSGTKELDASREVVWSVINDPAQMAGLMPGVEGFDVKDDRNWTAKVKVPITDHVQFLGLGLISRIDHLRIEDTDASGEVVGGQTGVVNASYFGVGVLLR